MVYSNIDSTPFEKITVICRHSRFGRLKKRGLLAMAACVRLNVVTCAKVSEIPETLDWFLKKRRVPNDAQLPFGPNRHQKGKKLKRTSFNMETLLKTIAYYKIKSQTRQFFCIAESRPYGRLVKIDVLQKNRTFSACLLCLISP